MPAAAALAAEVVPMAAPMRAVGSEVRAGEAAAVVPVAVAASAMLAVWAAAAAARRLLAAPRVASGS